MNNGNTFSIWFDSKLLGISRKIIKRTQVRLEDAR